MAPRKAVASTAETTDANVEDSQAPRRSSRASVRANTAEVDQKIKEKKPRASKNGAKRPAEGEDDKEKPSTKKAKAEEEKAIETDVPDLPQINIGDSLPAVTLKNEKEEDVDVANLAAEKGVVLFLVPKADTPGCTNQACGFRDIYPDFTSLNYDVYCVSADSPKAQEKWQTKKSLPYPLLSDPKRVLISALGAGEGGKTKRSHFIFDKGGNLVDKKIPVKPAESPTLALEFIKSQGNN